MAIFRFALPQPNNTTTLQDLANSLFEFGPTVVSSTFLRERENADNFLLIEGTGFVWEVGFGVDCIAGQITDLTFVKGGVAQLSVTDLKIDARAAFDAAGASSLDFLEYLFRGKDRVFLTTQNDSMETGTGDDTISCFAGDDTSSGNAGRDVVYGGRGEDVLYGGAGNDRLFGGKDAPNTSNSIFGGEGNDYLTGGNGLDYQFGGDGRDTLVGGLSFDTLTGGAGSDDFVFRSTANLMNNPFIVDFVSGEDRILLDNDRFAALGAPGILKPSQFQQATNAQDPNDRILYDFSGSFGRVWYDQDGRGGVEKKLIVILTSGINDIDAGDFRIIG